MSGPVWRKLFKVRENYNQAIIIDGARGDGEGESQVY